MVWFPGAAKAAEVFMIFSALIRPRSAYVKFELSGNILALVLRIISSVVITAYVFLPKERRRPCRSSAALYKVALHEDWQIIIRVDLEHCQSCHTEY